MTSAKAPALFALVGVIVAVVLFLVLKDDTADEDTIVSESPPAETTSGDSQDGGGQKPEDKPKPPKPEVPLIEIQGGKPVGGVQELEFGSGEKARFLVRSDAADELHFHCYDLNVDVEPGRTAKVFFDADIEGLCELESHTTGELLAEISVVPS